MLAAHSMGSHGGQQNIFGYIPNELHGIGLPDFITPGPPPGQPLLNEHDNQTLDSFFNGFDTGANTGKDGALQQFSSGVEHGQDWMMPPALVASETSLRNRPGTEWQHHHMNEFAFSADSHAALAPQPPGFESIHGATFATQNQFDPNVLHQLQSAAHATIPSFANTWQQSFNAPAPPQVPPPRKPLMRFGSDQHFQPSGYAAPEGQFDPNAVPNLDWLEPQSSAGNTQPNTRPNTQPSSPAWTKKRKLDDYQEDARRNGANTTLNGHATNARPASPSLASGHNTVTSQVDSTQAKVASQPPTPVVAHQQNSLHELEDSPDHDEEAQSRSPSPAPWPANKPRPPKLNKASASSKSIRQRKKSAASTAPIKMKSKTVRGPSNTTPTSRVPLTADQKKANHTNSEQRRRDATSRAYAELYDLVPELEEMGKQSTMKKLEVVVAKVNAVKTRVSQLRVLLGIDVDAADNSTSVRSTYAVPNASVFGSVGQNWQR